MTPDENQNNRNAIPVVDNVYWVGVRDPELEVFDIIMKTEHGTTYNAFVVKGTDKTALIDTAKKTHTDEFLARLTQVTPIEEIDYLFVLHNEPDHSGSIKDILDKNPSVKIICSAPALPFVKNVINREADIQGVKDGFEVDLGGKTLRCLGMPYMHWPDTMVAYLPEDKLLFSNDIFAAHVSFDGDQMWADQHADTFEHEHYYYWDCIMRPFSGFSRKNLTKLDKLDIDVIATSHGPLIRKDTSVWIQKYAEWSRDKAAGHNQVTIFYATSYGNTELIAKALADELTAKGLGTKTADVTTVSDADAKNLIEESNAIVIGTPTFNGDAVEPIWHITNLLSMVYRLGKKAAVFGSYGWGGEATKLVSERLSGLKLKVFEEDYRARLVPSDDELTELKAYAGRLAEFLGAGK